MIWPNGVVAQVFSAHDPESLRGPQFAAAWCDELGCGAVHAGATEPNRFADPKSVDGGRPLFSSGARADNEQRAFLEVHLKHWQDMASESGGSAGVPVDPDRVYLWAWDARPWPAFPVATDTWSDGVNWLTGHWLNGRLGAAPLRDLVAAVFDDHDMTRPEIDGLRTVVQGLVVDQVASIRDVLEPLALTFGFDVIDTGDGDLETVRITDTPTDITVVDRSMLVETPRRPVLHRSVAASGQAPSEVILRHRDGLDEYRTATSRARDASAVSRRQAEFTLPCNMDAALGEELADRILARSRNARHEVRFALPLTAKVAKPGDIVALSGSEDEPLKVVRVELTDRVDLALVPAQTDPPSRRQPRLGASAVTAAIASEGSGRPLPMILDLPLLSGSEPEEQAVRIAARVHPDAVMSVFASPDSDGFAFRTQLAGSSLMGVLASDLPVGREGVIDHGTRLLVRPFAGEFASISDTLFLAGRNLLAVEKEGGALELVQFRDAEEVAPGLWQLTTLLRGQGGTGDAAAISAVANARFAMVDERTPTAGMLASEAGTPMNWRVGLTGKPFTDRYAATVTAIAGRRARLPLSPVHLSARGLAGGAFELSWIRRTRRGGDSWDGIEVPLGEESEAYQVIWWAQDGTPSDPVTVSVPQFVLSAPQVAAAFSGAPATITFEVAQLSLAAGPGPAARKAAPVRPTSSSNT